jgi:hypothetical protein
LCQFALGVDAVRGQPAGGWGADGDIGRAAGQFKDTLFMLLRGY